MLAFGEKDCILLFLIHGVDTQNAKYDNILIIMITMFIMYQLWYHHIIPFSFCIFWDNRKRVH